MRLILCLCLLTACALQAACSTTSQFVADGRTTLSLPDPQNDIVVLFARGAGEFTAQDPCIPKSLAAFGGYSTPRVLDRLAKRRGDIHLFYVCDRDTLTGKGATEERRRIVPCEPGYRYSEDSDDVDSGAPLKVCQRAEAIETYARDFMEANPGLTPDRIFLTGTSTGGWASLLVAARNPDLDYHVIAFAPAFAGKNAKFRRRKKPGPLNIDTVKCGSPFGARDRGYIAVLPAGDFRRQTSPADLKNTEKDFETGEELFFCHAAHLSTKTVDALIFAFHGDPYQDPDSLSPVVDGLVVNALCRDNTRPGADFDCNRWGTPHPLCYDRDPVQSKEDCEDFAKLDEGVFAPRKLSDGLRGSVLISVPDDPVDTEFCRSAFGWVPFYASSPHACNQRTRFDLEYGPIIEAYIDCRTKRISGDACERLPTPRLLN